MKIKIKTLIVITMTTLKTNIIFGIYKTDYYIWIVVPKFLHIFERKMFFISVYITFLTSRVVCFLITLDESPLYKEDFQSLNHTVYPETMNIDDDDNFVTKTKIFLIFGYIMLLIMIVYVYKITNKNQSISQYQNSTP